MHFIKIKSAHLIIGFYNPIWPPTDATISSLITSALPYVGIISVEHTGMNVRPA
jgi:hypothetical protein